VYICAKTLLCWFDIRLEGQQLELITTNGASIFVNT